MLSVTINAFPCAVYDLLLAKSELTALYFKVSGGEVYFISPVDAPEGAVPNATVPSPSVTSASTVGK